MACWADEDEIMCVFADGARLLGPAAIRAAYAAILERGGLWVRPAQEMRLQGPTNCVHSVVERVSTILPDGRHDATVLATHVYQKTGIGWRMVARHASLAPWADAPAAPPDATLLH